MTTISYLKGDATAPVGDGPKVILHICNDCGGWGKGFVLALSRRWQEPEHSYRDWFSHRATNDFRLGAVQYVAVDKELWVANIVGQQGLTADATGRPPIRYEAVETALQDIAKFAQEKGASLHMPRIGCGLAGGEWKVIEALIQKACSSTGTKAFVYDLN